MYLTIKQKFCISISAALLWAAFSLTVAQPWISDLSETLGAFLAYTLIFGIAIIPGFINFFLVISILLDKRPPKKFLDHRDYPPITVLTAAYNEQDSIEETVRSIGANKYLGDMRCIVVSDGSTDDTPEILVRLAQEFDWLDVYHYTDNQGKAEALNFGLEHVDTEILITVDADSLLYKNALNHIVLRYLSDPADTRAVAGCILIRNSRESLCTRAQEWDYFLGINSIKRLQSKYHGTMVAQGAFSLYDTATVREQGGWEHSVGEDIVLTWGLHKAGHRVGFAEDAFLFTNAPVTWRQLIKQRMRWSRGMIEAFKHHAGLLTTKRYSAMFAWWNAMFPFLDLVYTVAFLPGIVAAIFFQYYLIAGLMTLILLPLMLIMKAVMYSNNVKTLNSVGLMVRKNFRGFLIYALVYSMILQPICFLGYLKEIFLGSNKNWGTK